MKNILFIHDYPLQEGGGVEIQTYQDATELVLRGFSVCILSSRASSETYCSSKKTYPYVTDTGVILDLASSIDSIRSRIIDADIVHIQATFSMRPAMMSAMKICKELGKKYIVTLHTNASHISFSALADMSVLEKDMYIEEFKMLLSSSLCTVVGVSQSISQSLASLGIFKDYEVIYNAKNWNKFLASNSLSCVSTIEVVDVTYIGEVSWMKGMHVLIGALTSITKTLPNIKVRVIGGGQNRKEVQTLVQSLGLLNNVIFVQYVENKDISQYLQATKILVQPSLSETWGNIVMEALVCGAYPVVSNTEGLPELVEYGRIGDVFEKGDVQDFSSKILNRISSPISMYKTGKSSKYIQEKYSMQNRIKALLKIYREVSITQERETRKNKTIAKRSV